MGFALKLHVNLCAPFLLFMSLFGSIHSLCRISPWNYTCELCLTAVTFPWRFCLYVSSPVHFGEGAWPSPVSLLPTQFKHLILYKSKHLCKQQPLTLEDLCARNRCTSSGFILHTCARKHGRVVFSQPHAEVGGLHCFHNSQTTPSYSPNLNSLFPCSLLFLNFIFFLYVLVSLLQPFLQQEWV